MRIYLPVLLIILISCADSDENNFPVSLEGTWVNTKTETDILIFHEGGDRDMFQLKRDKEMQNGHLLPKPGAGVYEYRVNGKTISLYNTISSCYCFNDYFFDPSSTELAIENFYDDKAGGNIQRFRKLE